MLLDTSAWIEFFISSSKGKKVEELLLQDKPFYICLLTLAEITNWCYKNNADPEVFIAKIRKFSRLLPLPEDILISSGRDYYEIRQKNKKISLIDVIIYSSATFHGLKLLTKDNDFKGLPNVEML